MGATITKGEMLERIFNHMDFLGLTEKMKKLFFKNNMSFADLTELKQRNKADFEAWQKMHKRNTRLLSFSTYVILEK